MNEAQDIPPPVAAGRRAIEMAGGPAVVARHFGIRLTAIPQWRERGIPATRVLGMEKLTGVSRHELRPDVFGDRG